MAGDDEREREDQSGRFTAEHSPEDVLDVMEVGEPYTAAEIHEATGIPKRTVNKYLNDLAERGRVRKKKPSKRSVIWLREESR